MAYIRNSVGALHLWQLHKIEIKSNQIKTWFKNTGVMPKMASRPGHNNLEYRNIEIELKI